MCLLPTSPVNHAHCLFHIHGNPQIWPDKGFPNYSTKEEGKHFLLEAGSCSFQSKLSLSTSPRFCLYFETQMDISWSFRLLGKQIFHCSFYFEFVWCLLCRSPNEPKIQQRDKQQQQQKYPKVLSLIKKNLKLNSCYVLCIFTVKNTHISP